MASNDRDSESNFTRDAYSHGETTGRVEGEEAVQYVLLAEFDIDAGATLAHQYPYPTGTEEQ
jgi:hypothetical protein